jgi:hypothetical protein
MRSGNNVTVSDYWMPDYGPPRLDTHVGGNEDYIMESGSYADSSLSAVFTRKLRTSDTNDWVFQEGVEFDYCWAWHHSDDTFIRLHKRDGAGTLTLGATLETSAITESEIKNQDEFESHGVLMAVVWIATAHAGILVARYGKAVYGWYWIHLLLSLFTIGATYFSVVETYELNEGYFDLMRDDQRYHSRLGVTLCSILFA